MMSVTPIKIYFSCQLFYYDKKYSRMLNINAAVQHERGPRTSTIRKQVALYFRGHKEVNGSSTHFPSASIPGPPFFTTVTQLEPHNLDLNTVTSTPERQAIVGLAQPTPKVAFSESKEFIEFINSLFFE